MQRLSRTRARRPGGCTSSPWPSARRSEERREVAVDLDRLRARRSVEQRRVNAPRPGPISTMRSPGWGFTAATMRRSTPGSCRKCWPKRLRARITALRRQASLRAGSPRTGCPDRRGRCRRGRAPCRDRPRCGRIGSPSVTLTASPKPACLSTGRPWSWYIASTASARSSEARREGRVRRQRAGALRCRGRERLERRLDHVDLLAAEMAAFAGVRIEAADERCAGARCRATHAGRGRARRRVRSSAFASDRARHLAQRQVRGRERHAQVPGHQHHHRMRAAGCRREVFRVTREGDAGIVDDALLHRRRHHRGEAAGDAAFGSGVQQGKHVAGIRGVRPARGRRRA